MNRSSSRFLALTGTLCFAMAGAGLAQGATSPTAPDASFVKMASAAGLAEVSLGKLATEKGQSDQVKTFGQTMVDDHTKAGDELKGIASGKSIPVAKAPMAADIKQTAMIGKKEGASFDGAFKTKMVADHKKVIALFTKESTSGKDPDLKAFAAKTLPTLQHHLEMAEQLPADQ